MKEYRLSWKREGKQPKRKRYVSLARLKKFALLFGAEPWKYYTSKGPHELGCCDGHMCGCGGMTVEEEWEKRNATMPKIEWVKIDEREVGEWCPISEKEKA